MWVNEFYAVEIIYISAPHLNCNTARLDRNKFLISRGQSFFFKHKPNKVDIYIYVDLTVYKNTIDILFYII